MVDEACGQLLVLFSVPESWSVLLISFFLFRIFDIIKPFPIKKVENLPSGWGIMADDIMAAIYAGIFLHLYLILKMKKNCELKIEIIAIGSELLTPYFQDTNSLYLTERLNDLGLVVSFKTIVGDDWEKLLLIAQEALSHADLIFAIGGLGPTQDDRTREVFAQVLKRKLIFKKELLQKIRERFKKRGLVMPSPNKKQAYIIDGAIALKNNNGTAPGIWLDRGQQAIILLPGPPHELRLIFEESV